jgi:hypothetical protein
MRMRLFSSRFGRQSFALFEAMLGVAVFALGAVALAHSVHHCIVAEQARTDDFLARLALENWMAELLGGSRSIEAIEGVAALLAPGNTTGSGADSETKLEGMWLGMTMREKVGFPKGKPLINEFDEPLKEILEVTLEVKWKVEDQPQSKSVTFYCMPRPPSPANTPAPSDE